MLAAASVPSFFPIANMRVAFAARKLRKTVKWAADRADHFLGDAQGRDNVTRARMALAEDGRFLAMISI